MSASEHSAPPCLHLSWVSDPLTSVSDLPIHYCEDCGEIVLDRGEGAIGA